LAALIRLGRGASIGVTMYSKLTRALASRIALEVAFAILASAITTAAAQAQIEGFTEPYRATELASEESGIIAKLHVAEGTSVKAGEPIATLDDRAQRLRLELAEHLAKSTSNVDAARQTLEKRDVVLERLRQMLEKGHAAESELLRADLERAIAYSRLLTAEEEAATREIELRRSQLDVNRRTITAPFDGVVDKIIRHEGEFLSPVKPEVVHLIQVDVLWAVFPIPSSQVRSLKPGQEINVRFDDGTTLLGTVQHVAPTTDAQSDTVMVKIMLNNALGMLRSGQRCYLHL
jgi:RND family efflux transporter MFP subunit